MKTNFLRISALSLAVACGMGAAYAEPTNEMVIQTNKVGAEIQPTMYGLFFEDINLAEPVVCLPK